MKGRRNREERPEEWDFVTNWQDPDERAFALDSAEAAFAEACYLEDPPPAPATFVSSWGAALPGIGEPEMPKEAKRELMARCLSATIRIAIADETYEHWRNIATEEDREAARERRRSSREACKRWRESGFEDVDAFDEMRRSIDETNAERRKA